MSSYPDQKCETSIFSTKLTCVSKTYKIERQDSIYYSPVHGFPSNLDCVIDQFGIISCHDPEKHVHLTGTFPQRKSKLKNCPIGWITMDIVIYKEYDTYFIDFEDIRLKNGKVICELILCNLRW